MFTDNEPFIESIAQMGGLELLRAVEEEFRMGWEREKAMVELERQRLSEACTRLESAAVDGLGHIESDIPAASYFYWWRKEPGCWKDKTFRKEFLRDNPQFKVRYRNPKPRTGWTPPAPAARHELIATGSKYGLGVAA